MDAFLCIQNKRLEEVSASLLAWQSDLEGKISFTKSSHCTLSRLCPPRQVVKPTKPSLSARAMR